MIETFKCHVTTDKFFRDLADFQIERQSSYYLSYPEFIKYFRDLKIITWHNLVIGINFTYGWMPTMFDFRSDNFDEAVKILNSAKQGTIPTTDELLLLKGLFNNSLVGTTKLLHFINPNTFAIWDRRVYRYLTGSEPYDNRIGDCDAYLAYLEFCDYLIKQEGFNDLRKSLEEKVGYSMTPFRAAELVMYSNGAAAP